MSRFEVKFANRPENQYSRASSNNPPRGRHPRLFVLVPSPRVLLYPYANENTQVGNPLPARVTRGEELAMDNTQLAELLMGIAKAQSAVLDAVERAQPGFKNNHAVPILTTAANVRAAVPRIQDLPARILLRMQGRAAFDVAQIQQDLEAAFASDGVSPGASAEPGANLSPAAIRAAARVPEAAPAAPASAAAAPGKDLDFSAKS
jgi:hypothetical protein